MTEIFTIFALFYLIFLIVMIGLGIWGFIYFIRLASRGIKALDIYIDEKSNKKSNDYYDGDNKSEY